MPATLSTRFAAVDGQRVSAERLMRNADLVQNAAMNLAHRRMTRQSLMLQMPALTSTSGAGDRTISFTPDRSVTVRKVEVTLNAADTETYTFTLSTDSETATVGLEGDSAESVVGTINPDDIATESVSIAITGTGSWSIAGAIIILHIESDGLPGGLPEIPSLSLDENMLFTDAASALNAWFGAMETAIGGLKNLRQTWVDFALIPYAPDAIASDDSLGGATDAIVLVSPGHPEQVADTRISNIGPVAASLKRYYWAHAAASTGDPGSPDLFFFEGALLPTTGVAAVGFDLPTDTGAIRRDANVQTMYLNRKADGDNSVQYLFAEVIRICYLDN